MTNTMNIKKRLTSLRNDLVQADKTLSGSLRKKVKSNLKVKIKLLEAKLDVMEKSARLKSSKARLTTIKKTLTRRIKSRGKTPKLF